MPAVELDVALFFDGLTLDHDLLFEVRQIFVALFDVDPGDQVGREVDDLLELLGLQLFTGLGAHEQVGQPRTRAAQVPDVHDRRGQLDVAHALAPHLGARDLDAAALADDALEAHALVLAAVALPVLRGTEDLLAEQAVLLGLERAVVDRLGLLHLAVRPHADLVCSGQVRCAAGKSRLHQAFVNPLRGRAIDDRWRVHRFRHLNLALGERGRCRVLRRCGTRLRRARASRSRDRRAP